MGNKQLRLPLIVSLVQLTACATTGEETTIQATGEEQSPLAPYRELIDPVDAPLALPATPRLALIDAIRQLSSSAGVPRDAFLAVVAANYDDVLAGRLANVVRALDQCTRLTKSGLSNTTVSDLLRNNSSGALDRVELQHCAKTLSQAARDLERELLRRPPGGQPLTVHPIIRVDLSDTNNRYVDDYLLLVDRGGDDLYKNNAGSNVFDPRQPAVGCQTAIDGFVARHCFAAAAAFIDVDGNDTYGEMDLPDPDVDGQCTDDRVILRMLTNAVGLAGVGILIDTRGNDVYLGKTISNGAGHIGGIGILNDREGNDSYLSVRNSQGFGLIGGFGMLRDSAGADRYDFYMPSAKDPDAQDQEPGAGGVADDTPTGEPLGNGFLCDKTPRFTLGAGDFAGVGVLVDEAGGDWYRGAFRGSFKTPLPENVDEGRSGSIGFGNNGGFGAFYERAGLDTYVIDYDAGTVTRSNDSQEEPALSCDGTSTTCSGVFVDQGS